MHTIIFYGWNFLIFSRVIRTSENLPGSTKIFRVYLFREIQISQGIRPVFFTPVKKILSWTFPTFVHDSFKLPKKKIEFLREKISPGKCAKFKIIPGKSYLCLRKFLKMYISNAQTTSWNSMASYHSLSVFLDKKKNCIRPVITPTLRERLLIPRR